MIMSHLRSFRNSEDGAVTIDWVVLTAALLILGIVVSAYIWNGSTEMAGNTGDALGNATVPEVVF